MSDYLPNIAKFNIASQGLERAGNVLGKCQNNVIFCLILMRNHAYSQCKRRAHYEKALNMEPSDLTLAWESHKNHALHDWDFLNHLNHLTNELIIANDIPEFSKIASQAVERLYEKINPMLRFINEKELELLPKLSKVEKKDAAEVVDSSDSADEEDGFLKEDTDSIKSVLFDILTYTDSMSSIGHEVVNNFYDKLLPMLEFDEDVIDDDDPQPSTSTNTKRIYCWQRIFSPKTMPLMTKFHVESFTHFKMHNTMFNLVIIIALDKFRAEFKMENVNLNNMIRSLISSTIATMYAVHLPEELEKFRKDYDTLNLLSNEDLFKYLDSCVFRVVSLQNFTSLNASDLHSADIRQEIIVADANDKDEPKEAKILDFKSNCNCWAHMNLAAQNKQQDNDDDDDEDDDEETDNATNDDDDSLDPGPSTSKKQGVNVVKKSSTETGSPNKFDAVNDSTDGSDGVTVVATTRNLEPLTNDNNDGLEPGPSTSKKPRVDVFKEPSAEARLQNEPNAVNDSTEGSDEVTVVGPLATSNLEPLTNDNNDNLEPGSSTSEGQNVATVEESSAETESQNEPDAVNDTTEGSDEVTVVASPTTINTDPLTNDNNNSLEPGSSTSKDQNVAAVEEQPLGAKSPNDTDAVNDSTEGSDEVTVVVAPAAIVQQENVQVAPILEILGISPLAVRPPPTFSSPPYEIIDVVTVDDEQDVNIDRVEVVGDNLQNAIVNPMPSNPTDVVAPAEVIVESANTNSAQNNVLQELALIPISADPGVVTVTNAPPPTPEPGVIENRNGGMATGSSQHHNYLPPPQIVQLPRNAPVNYAPVASFEPVPSSSGFRHEDEPPAKITRKRRTRAEIEAALEAREVSIDAREAVLLERERIHQMETQRLLQKEHSWNKKMYEIQMMNQMQARKQTEVQSAQFRTNEGRQATTETLRSQVTFDYGHFLQANNLLPATSQPNQHPLSIASMTQNFAMPMAQQPQTSQMPGPSQRPSSHQMPGSSQGALPRGQRSYAQSTSQNGFTPHTTSTSHGSMMPQMPPHVQHDRRISSTPSTSQVQRMPLSPYGLPYGQSDRAVPSTSQVQNMAYASFAQQYGQPNRAATAIPSTPQVQNTPQFPFLPNLPTMEQAMALVQLYAAAQNQQNASTNPPR